MPLSEQDVLHALGRIEGNSRRIAARLGPEALPHLEAIAQRDDERYAAGAIQVAVLIDASRAAPLVVEGMQSPLEGVRLAAAQSLAHLDPAEAGEPLMRGLADDDPGVRRLAVRSAAALSGVPEAASAVERMASDEREPAIRALASRVLPRVRGEAPSAEEIETALLVAKPQADDAAALGPAAIPAFVKAARDAEPQQFATVARYAMLAPGVDPSEVLVAGAENPNPAVRAASVTALQRVASPHLPRVVERLLADADPNVQTTALRSARELLGDDALRSRVEELATQEGDTTLQRLAGELLGPDGTTAPGNDG